MKILERLIRRLNRERIETEEAVLAAREYDARLEVYRKELCQIAEKHGFTVRHDTIRNILTRLADDGHVIPVMIIECTGICDTERRVITVPNYNRISLVYIRALAHEVFHAILGHESGYDHAEEEAEALSEYLLLSLGLLHEWHDMIVKIASRALRS